MNRASTAILSMLAALKLAACSASAGQSAILCAAARQSVASEPLLATAVAAAFGKAPFSSTSEDCAYPLTVLRYSIADVLIVQAGEPGQACHGCGAALTAYVLRRSDDRLKPVRAFRKFATLGTAGAVDDMSPTEIGDDDGMAIESGGTFQGYASTVVDFFAFHSGQLVKLNTTPIIIAADNGGAVVDPGKAIDVTAKWSFDPADKTALVVDYKIKAHGVARAERVIWRLQGTSLVLSHGRVPAEVSEASGG